MQKLIQLLLIILLCSTAGNSQTVETSHDEKRPRLNGHAFLTSTGLRSSFINTSLQADVGFGTTSVLQIPGIMIGDHELFAFEGQILFVDIGVQYQQRFTPWLAMYATFQMAGRLGTDLSTILADGVNTLAGGEIGWLIRLKQTEKFNLSANLSVVNVSGSFINVTDYLEDVLNDIPYPSVIKKVPAMGVNLGLRGAYAFNPTWGLQFQLDYAYGESFERSSTKGYVSGGIMGDIDFLPKSDVPIGLALGYALSTAPEIVMNNGGVSNLFIAKIGYTGSDEFELGLQFTYYNVELMSVDSNPFINKVLLTMKFYF